MASAADPVEDDAGEVQTRIEVDEPLDQGGGAARLAGGVDHQQHRDVEPAGDLGARAFVAVAAGAVEQSHHPLDDRRLCSRAAAGEDLAHRRLAAHPAVEVARGAAAHPGVVARVDKVGAHLEGGDRHAAAPQGGHQRQGDGGLAVAAGRRGDQKR